MAERIQITEVCPRLLGKDGKEISTEQATAGKHVGLYFSASWCPPCRQFTPMLARVYEKLKAEGKNFEVVFVSSDRSEQQFQEYYHHHPWLAVPFHSPARGALSSACRVMGIPTLVILGPDGTVVAPNARSAVMSDPAGERFPWAGASAGGGSMLPLILLFMLFWWLARWFMGK